MSAASRTGLGLQIPSFDVEQLEHAVSGFGLVFAVETAVVDFVRLYQVSPVQIADKFVLRVLPSGNLLVGPLPGILPDVACQKVERLVE